MQMDDHPRSKIIPVMRIHDTIPLDLGLRPAPAQKDQ
jgi:hypothetical protein